MRRPFLRVTVPIGLLLGATGCVPHKRATTAHEVDIECPCGALCTFHAFPPTREPRVTTWGGAPVPEDPPEVATDGPTTCAQCGTSHADRVREIMLDRSAR